MRRLCLSLAIAVATASTLAPSARADEGQTRARALFEEGVALAKESRWADACPKLFPGIGIGTRGKLAECYEHTGRVASAWRLWREVAQLAMRAGEPAREQLASEHAKALEPKLSYVTVSVAPGADTSGLVVKRDGHDLERAKLGAAEPVDPGAVAIEATAPGKKPFQTKLTVGKATLATVLFAGGL